MAEAQALSGSGEHTGTAIQLMPQIEFALDWILLASSAQQSELRVCVVLSTVYTCKICARLFGSLATVACISLWPSNARPQHAHEREAHENRSLAQFASAQEVQSSSETALFLLNQCALLHSRLPEYSSGTGFTSTTTSARCRAGARALTAAELHGWLLLPASQSSSLSQPPV